MEISNAPAPAPSANGTLNVPARHIPIPSSLSPRAQAMMAHPSMVGLPYPRTNDTETWLSYVEAMDGIVLGAISALQSRVQVKVEEQRAGSARIFVIRSLVPRVAERFAYLDIHGGGLVMGGGELCRAFGIATADRIGATVWTVDYRMPPLHPYPCALDDCVATYRAMLDHYQPRDIIIGGGSAGGNLAAALILRARDEGLPLPAAAYLGTPELDLTESGDSFRTNLGLDARLTESLMPANLLYAAGHSLTDPYLSPLFGDFSKGFPPTLLTSGTRDLFLSNAVQMHWALRNQGIAAELYIDEAGSHGGFSGCPESEQVQREINRFLIEHWGYPH